MIAFPYGAVLKVQREWTIEDIRSKLNDMKRCGMNIVVIWPAVFWWENRAHAEYPFHTGIEILKHAETIGMKVIMELAGQITALEYAPDFLMREDYYARKADGTPKNEGYVFDCLNYNHPEVKELVRKNFSDAARAYKDYKALYGYDILNETMFTTYDRYTLQLYRTWLEQKYGTIERLNEVWDRTYYGWNQIEFNFWLWPSVMPYVDWQQFRKANVGMILSEWRGYVKAVDPDRPTIADNINSMLATDQFYGRPHDDWNAAANVDEYGISFYPKEDLAGTPPYKRWETFVGIHSATRTGRFWISELQSHHRNMFKPNSVVYPHELKWWAWEAISHGAMGLIYWKWDPFVKGIQTAGRGLVDAKGNPTPRAKAAAEIAEILEAHAEAFVAYAPEQPRVAIVYDKLTHDFTKAYTFSVPQETSIYVDSIAGLYECLWELNIPVKFVTPQDVVEGKADAYRALFLTNQLAVGPAFAVALQHYAEQGGMVIADGKFGEIGEDGVLNEDTPGGALNEALGCRLVDIDPLGLDITIGAEASDGGDGGTLPGYFERKLLEIVQPQEEVWGRYGDGYPAVVSSSIGRGRIVYISTMLWYGYNKQPNPEVLRWLRRLDRTFGFSLHMSGDPRLKLCTARGEDGMLVYMFNYTDEAITSEIAINGFACKSETVSVEAIVPSGTVSHRQSTDGRIVLQVDVPAREVAICKLKRRN
ncbi:MAG: hypothetical protein K0R28_69 [Paenibacillus sp.]|jgi:beta-galactosidase|nr:hypothetical protein [Paenibacillus sp.]